MSMIPVATVIGEVQGYAHRAANGDHAKVSEEMKLMFPHDAPTREQRITRAAMLIASVAVEDFGSP